MAGEVEEEICYQTVEDLRWMWWSTGETVDSWKERLPEIVQGYSKDNIWNMDETGLFFRALPDRGFAQKSRSCKGGKKSKQRVTIALFVSASGHKEKPVFIWKSENPRCLLGFDKSCLPVSYYSQSKAWMSEEILACSSPTKIFFCWGIMLVFTLKNWSPSFRT